MKKIFLALIILLCAITAFAACDTTEPDPLDDATIINVTIKTPAKKIVFNMGESFSSVGLVLEATYVTGHTRQVTAEGYTVDSSNYDPDTEAFYEITATLKTADFSVTYMVCVGTPKVEPVSISIKTAPTKLKYLIDEPVETAGIVVTALNNNKKRVEVAADDLSFDDSNVDKTKPGAYDVIVYLTMNPAVKTSYKVSYSKQIASIEVSKLPDQTEFFLNETFNYSGLIIKATNIDMSKTDLSEFSYEVITTDYDAKKNTAGAKPTITVRLKSDSSVTASYTVEIFDAKAITAYAHNVIFEQGSSFASSLYSVRATYGSDTRTHSIDISRCGIDSSAFNGNVVGEYQIKVYLKSNPSIFDYYTVKVDGIVSIFVSTKPAKTQYFIGDALDLKGLRIGAEFGDETKATLADTRYNIDSSAYKANIAGKYEIIVSLKGQSAIKTTFEVEVFDAEAIELSAESQHQTEYAYAEVFNPYGIRVNALFGEGGMCELAYSNLTIDNSKYKRILSGTYTITVSLTSNPSLTCEYEVTVLPKGEDKIIALQISNVPTSGHKTKFSLGSSFDYIGLYIRGYTSDKSGGSGVDGGSHYPDYKSGGRLMAPGELTVDSSAYDPDTPGTYKIDIYYKKDTTVKTSYNVEVVASDAYVVRFECRFAPLVKPLPDMTATDLNVSVRDFLVKNQYRAYFEGYKFMAYYLDDLYGIDFPETDLLSALPATDNVITIYMRYDMDYANAYNHKDGQVSGVYTQEFNFYNYESRYLVHKYSDTLTFVNYVKLTPNVTDNYTFSGLGMAGYSGGLTGYVPIRIFEYGNINDPVNESKEILCFDSNGDYTGYNLTAGKQYVVCYMYDLSPTVYMAKTVKITISFSAEVAEEFGFNELTVSIPKGLDVSTIILDLFSGAASDLGGRFEFYTDSAFTTAVNQNAKVNVNATYYLDLIKDED